MTRSLSALLAASVCLIGVQAARADVIVSPTITSSFGNYSYNYSVSNFGQSAIVGFNLTVAGPVSQIQSPAGWTYTSSFFGQQTYIQWTSLGGQFLLVPGASTSGFIVVSSSSPGQAQYTATDQTFRTFSGQTIGPRLCTYTLSAYSQNIGVAGGNSQLTVVTGDGCVWDVVTSVPWIGLGVVNGNGTAPIAFNVAPNYGNPPRNGYITVAGVPFAVIQNGGPILALSQTALNFGVGGGLVTSPQKVLMTFTGVANATWSAYSNQPNITVSPASGTGNAMLTISASAGPGGLITISANGVTNPTQFIQVNVNAAVPTVPFGSFDTPLASVNTVAGAIPVTGWALDTIEITKLDIWREPIPGETPTPNGLIYIADAVFVDFARPDVQATYPTTPRNYRAGWGYLLLTNILPNNGGAPGPGNGMYRLHAIAHNKAGLSTDLGVRVINVDNADAAKPFGTIDTPAQGATVAGSGFVNFGWVLTPNPYTIPINASTIQVMVDGESIGNPVYNQFRSDIAALFPGLANSNGAVGYFIIDMSKVINGLHTISWMVTDTGGRSDGIGSRFFNVFNAVSPASGPPPQGSNASDGSVTFRRGYGRERAFERLTPDSGGGYSIDIEELDRIELNAGAAAGYLLIGDQRAPLPAGSSFRDGVFYWQAGPGFFGDYSLVLERSDGSSIPVRVRIRPKSWADCQSAGACQAVP